MLEGWADSKSLLGNPPSSPALEFSFILRLPASRPGHKARREYLKMTRPTGRGVKGAGRMEPHVEGASWGPPAWRPCPTRSLDNGFLPPRPTFGLVTKGWTLHLAALELDSGRHGWRGCVSCSWTSPSMSPRISRVPVPPHQGFT